MAHVDANEVLAGGGEMGALMRSVDWSKTTLGPVASWPQSLRTTVSTCLNSRFPILVWWGPNMVKLYNDAYRPMLGNKHPKSMGAPGREVWPEIWHIIGPMLEGVLKEGKATWSENQLFLLERHGFAEECYFTYSYSPIRDESGSVGGIYCAVTETTLQVLSERRLRTLREMAASAAGATSMAEALRLSGDAISKNPLDIPFALFYALEGDSARLVSNAGIDAGLEISPPTIRLENVHERLPFAEVVRTNQSQLVEDVERFGEFPIPDGVPRPNRLLVIPIGLAGDARASAVMVAGLSPRLMFDEKYRSFLELVAGHVSTAIASARALEEAQRQARALAEIDRAKTTFFSNISHEFRTPLTLMLGPTEDLLSGAHGEVTPPQRAQLELLRRNELRLQRLVNALLEFSRIEAGRIQATFEPVDLASLTRDLASSFRAAIERAGLTFTVDCPPLDEPIFVDRSMWEQIVMNLLSNAFKFTFEGDIALSLCARDDHVLLHVSDTGVGVRPEEVPRLFERFHRVEGTRSRTQEGSGIGLALVQELVRLHAGTIVADSTYGVGTSFTITIPKGFQHLPKERLSPAGVQATIAISPTFIEEALRWLPDDEREPYAGDAVDSTPPPVEGGGPTTVAGPRARILVADDNADMRQYLRRILGEWWEVETVRNGAAAFEAARAHKPGLVLTDVMMPLLDGFGLLRKLRADPETSAIPVIMLSARAGDESRVDGLRAGADDYLVKPFSARELVARVRTHLELAKLRDEHRAQREYLASLFMQAPVAICVLRGADLVFELANPVCLEIVRNKDVLGKPLVDALPEIRGRGFDDLLRGVMRTGEPWIAVELLARVARDPDGVLEDAYFSFSAVGIRNPQDVIDRVMVVASEVTEQVVARHRAEEAQRQVLRSESDLRQALALRDEFLTVASHELRTPLTTLGLRADGLLRSLQQASAPDAATKEWLEKAEKLRAQADRLERLIEGMLDVFSVGSDKLELHREQLDLAEVARVVIERLQKESRQATNIRLRAEPSIGAWDRRRLDQIFTSLISNALKFGVGQPVDVIVGGTMETARLCVKDAGVGIASDDQERIFGRFVRAVPSDQYGGFGLGLWLVREIVRAMGGSVRVDSAPGAGTTFTVELPRHP